MNIDKLFDTAYEQYSALREMLCYDFRDNTIGVRRKFRFKPVFYIRPDVLAELMINFSCDVKYSVHEETPTLFGVEVHMTPNENAPEISLALEPVKKELTHEKENHKRR